MYYIQFTNSVLPSMFTLMSKMILRQAISRILQVPVEELLPISIAIILIPIPIWHMVLFHVLATVS